MQFQVMDARTRQVLVKGLSEADARFHASELNRSFPGLSFVWGKDEVN